MRALVILTVLLFGAVAAAQAPTVKASVLNTNDGTFTEVTFEGESAVIGQANQVGYASEMLLVIGVTGSERAALTAEQGKKSVKKKLKAPRAKKDWHGMLLVPVNLCGGPMSIVVTAGKEKTVRTVEFECGP